MSVTAALTCSATVTLRLITRDHSVVASLIAEGQLQPEEVYLHPQRNVIYRYLGQKGQAQPDIFQHWLQPGDQLLLCSDGLWEMIRSEPEIVRDHGEGGRSKAGLPGFGPGGEPPGR